jgi:hypothetical protein
MPTENDTETLSGRPNSQCVRNRLSLRHSSPEEHSYVSGAVETAHADTAQPEVPDPEHSSSKDETTAEKDHQANNQQPSEAEYKCIYPGCTQRFARRYDFDKHEQGYHFPPLFSPWSKVLREHQKTISGIAVLEQQHAGFVQQNLAFRDTHERQEDSINAILTLLATFYRRYHTEGAPGLFFGRTREV